MGVGCCVERERTESVCKCLTLVCECVSAGVCVLYASYSVQGSHTRLMAGVEVFKRMPQRPQTQLIHQIGPAIVAVLHSLLMCSKSPGLN